MKQESGQFHILPDGAVDFGNGAIGPSASDRNYFNALRYSDQKPLSPRKSTLSSPKPKPNWNGLGFFSTAMTSALIVSACSGGEAKRVTDNSDNEPPGLALPFEGTGFLNSGPHNFKLERGAPTEKEIVSELDFAPKPVIKCEPGVRAIVTDWNITASESGKVTVAGDEKNELDSNHSIIQIKHPDGKSTRYTHVANIQVKKDQEVARRQKLGNPSCEYPPSGSTDGLHLDFSVLDPHGNPIDIRKISLSGWEIQGNRNYQGTMTKDGKTITADRRRCPVGNPCDGGKIVNSITHDSSKTPRKAVLGAEKSPNSQISGNVNEKRVEGVIATTRPTEKPTPAPTPKTSERKVSVSKKPDELFRTLLSTPIEQSSLPPGMKTKTYSAGTLDATSQALKAVGQVNIQISDGDPKFSGQPDGALSFTVFPDAESARAAYNTIINSAEKKQAEEGFPYPTTSLGTEGFLGGIKVIITTMPAENVLITAMLSDMPDYSGGYSNAKPARYKQNETIALAKSGVEHLRKVGR